MTMLIDDRPGRGGTVRVRLGPTRYHHMTLDGCWWPRSATPEAELPGLVPALNGVHGPVVRLLLSAAGWSRRPHQITVADRAVSLGYFADRSPTMLTAICADGDTVTLLVVPAKSHRTGTRSGEDRWENEGGRLAPHDVEIPGDAAAGGVSGGIRSTG
ncbi:DUF5994 family protein [Paractinoplanes rishiriensis]|uniref:Uncharacterized protein n=1 Tax=Paractinoplanes rishiriensis TaxID=1050105 RepID=A0A919K9S4_9ACTN|nr:DUF5994 family protein [Actinoplanes rishiriensis]GIF01300.1 hypothetical protein Ari01nite_87640 [Actinoplanes rishiriensis]